MSSTMSPGTTRETRRLAAERAEAAEPSAEIWVQVVLTSEASRRAIQKSLRLASAFSAANYLDLGWGRG